MSFYPMIYISFRRQHPCPFHFHLFCFEANINIQFPHPFTDTFCSIIQVFSLFFSKFVCRLTCTPCTSVLSFHVYFLVENTLKACFADILYVSSESRLTGQKTSSGFSRLFIRQYVKHQNTCYPNHWFPILNKTTMVEN